MRPYLTLLALPLPLALALGGCHLFDQTDVDRKPAARVETPPAAAPPASTTAAADTKNDAKTDTRPALITIDYATPKPNYRKTLDDTVRTVELRRPGILYDVVAVYGDEKEAAAARANAVEVMKEIQLQGVLPTRVQLSLNQEAGRKTRQVRVYLR